jgi:hypothetical protein
MGLVEIWVTKGSRHHLACGTILWMRPGRQGSLLELDMKKRHSISQPELVHQNLPRDTSDVLLSDKLIVGNASSCIIM